jgi:hypothetical protein
MKNIWVRISFVSLFSIIATSCMHPMAMSEIDQLTTCSPGVDLTKVKKNLLLAGYGIEHMGDEELVTDYKQGGGRQWQRITALKMEDKIKFKVRLRAESRESAPSSSSSTTYTMGKRKKSETVQTDTYTSERVVNDMDQSYWIERRADYERTKMEVCGTL